MPEGGKVQGRGSDHPLPAQIEWKLLNPANGPGPDIVDYLKGESYKQVIMGSRGYGAIKRSFYSLVGLGSVSDYVLHHAHCPVTVVKAHETEAPSKEQQTTGGEE